MSRSDFLLRDERLGASQSTQRHWEVAVRQPIPLPRRLEHLGGNAIQRGDLPVIHQSSSLLCALEGTGEALTCHSATWLAQKDRHWPKTATRSSQAFPAGTDSRIGCFFFFFLLFFFLPRWLKAAFFLEHNLIRGDPLRRAAVTETRTRVPSTPVQLCGARGELGAGGGRGFGGGGGGGREHAACRVRLCVYK